MEHLLQAANLFFVLISQCIAMAPSSTFLIYIYKYAEEYDAD